MDAQKPEDLFAIGKPKESEKEKLSTLNDFSKLEELEVEVGRLFSAFGALDYTHREIGETLSNIGQVLERMDNRITTLYKYLTSIIDILKAKQILNEEEIQQAQFKTNQKNPN